MPAVQRYSLLTRIIAFKALLSSHNDYVQLSSAEAASGKTSIPEDRGIILLLSADTIEAELERVVCDILRIRSESDLKSDTAHAPVASKHLTIAIEDSHEPLLPLMRAKTILEELVAGGKCISKEAAEQASQGITLRKATEKSVTSAIETLRPLAVLFVKGSKLEGAVEATTRKTAGATISIAMPQEDLENTGWIFSLAEKALQGESFVPKLGLPTCVLTRLCFCLY
jgi:hypothetical protein